MKTKNAVSTLLIALLCACSSNATPNKAEKGLDIPKTETTTATEQSAGDTGNTTRERGVKFHEITLAEAMEKAKAEGKFVLVDCHTKSCAPCRKMEKKVFPNETLGKYINERFVSIKMDMEEGEGIETGKKYLVQIYPTLLVLRPDGFKEGEIIGATFDIDEIIGMFRTILHEKK